MMQQSALVTTILMRTCTAMIDYVFSYLVGHFWKFI